MGGIAIPSAILYNRGSCMRTAVCNMRAVVGTQLANGYRADVKPILKSISAQCRFSERSDLGPLTFCNEYYVGPMSDTILARN